MAPHEQVAAWWRAAVQVCVLTGAGMSAESGVPTFRDARQGLWARFDPQQLASEAGFRRDPQLVWNWYAWRRAAVQAAVPNAGHLALARLARMARLTVVTQNVDGLHQRAGSRGVVELHGNLVATRCLEDCGTVIDNPAKLPAGTPPACPRCGAPLRPAVVWFGEALDSDRLQQAQQAAGASELMLVVGTSGLVYPAAGLPAVARSAGAKVVVINPAPTELDADADLVWTATAATALPALASALGA